MLKMLGCQKKKQNCKCRIAILFCSIYICFFLKFDFDATTVKSRAVDQSTIQFLNIYSLIQNE